MDPNASFPSTGLESVSTFWKSFNLEKRRGEFDEIGFRITEQQEQSVQQRRSLATATQQFKKSAERTVVAAVGELLRHYQQEIDRLTTRAKYSERAFLDVYNQLIEAPDPAHGLEVATKMTTRIIELESIVQKQSKELEEYSAESAEIKNQDLTIRRLEEKIRSLESNLSEEMDRVEEMRKDIRNEIQEEMQARETTLQKMLDDSNHTLESVRKMHQASQDKIFMMESQNEKLKARYSAELEMAAAEIEKSHHRIAELETEKQERQGRGPAQEQENEEFMQRIEILEKELQSAQEKTNMVKNDLETMQRSHQEEIEWHRARVTGVEKDLEKKEDLLESLEDELARRPTEKEMEELRKQLRILQAVQYNADDDGTTDSMETLLLKKNKHLEHQLTTEKLKKTELSQRVTDQELTIKKFTDDLEQSQGLITKLEADLLIAQESRGLRTVSTTSELDDALPDDTSQSMLSILHNQRDRLRQRTQDLEAKLSQAEKQMKSIQLESKTTAADNVALVERLRYLQGYRKENFSREDVETGLNAEQKYSKAYEDRINPFREFQGRQRERRKRELGFLDRTVFLVGDLVFGNKYARLFVCLYVIFLHVLVMTMLWVFTHRHSPNELSAEGVDSFCDAHGYKKANIS